MIAAYDSVVIGGGIGGLAAAYTLYKRGYRVLVIEAANRVGGVIHSITTPEGFTLDCGPNTLGTKDVRLWQELVDLGLRERITLAERCSKRRFILIKGRPIAHTNLTDWPHRHVITLVAGQSACPGGAIC
jgi:protoporphyrinogen oxidase (EC 1.3.3.4)